jgi:hypothetical protein
MAAFFEAKKEEGPHSYPAYPGLPPLPVSGQCLLTTIRKSIMNYRKRLWCDA